MLKISHPLEYTISVYSDLESRKSNLTGVDPSLPICINISQFINEFILEKESIYKRYPELRNHTIDLIMTQDEDELKKLSEVTVENLGDTGFDVSWGLTPNPQVLMPNEKIKLVNIDAFSDKKNRNEFIINLLIKCIFTTTMRVDFGSLKGHYHIEPNKTLANTLIMLYTISLQRINDVSMTTKMYCEEIISLYNRLYSTPDLYFVMDKTIHEYSSDFIDLPTDACYVSYGGNFPAFSDNVIDYKKLRIDFSNKKFKLENIVDFIVLLLNGYITLSPEVFEEHKHIAINNLAFPFRYKKLVMDVYLADKEYLVLNNTEINKKGRVDGFINILTSFIDTLKSGNHIQRIKNSTRCKELTEIYDETIKQTISFTQEEMDTMNRFYGHMDIETLLKELYRVLQVIANSYGK